MYGKMMNDEWQLPPMPHTDTNTRHPRYNHSEPPPTGPTLPSHQHVKQHPGARKWPRIWYNLSFGPSRYFIIGFLIKYVDSTHIHPTQAQDVDCNDIDNESQDHFTMSLLLGGEKTQHQRSMGMFFFPYLITFY